MSKPIILYDLARPGATSDSEQSWSGNTLRYARTSLSFTHRTDNKPPSHRTRFALNIKGIPFCTEWVKFADVESKIKSLGLEPSHDGLLAYTVPTIVDPSTQRVITDSFAITKYLDETYPDTPTLIPAGTGALQSAFVDKVVRSIVLAAFASLVGPVYEAGCFDEADRAHYRKTREAWFGGKPLEDIIKMGDEGMESGCKAYSDGLSEMAKYAEQAGGEGVFLSGQGPWFADTAVAAALTFTLKACGREHPFSKAILEHEWANKLLAAFDKWA
ncbi:unnamed protein product [Peniophora sp. CBMAI 1063]|nr:unnamed protein product [Peniophora sp. CBMAI 1063]